MTAFLIQPVWSRVLNRFRDLTTGRIISTKVAVPLLRSSGGAFRDVLGRHVPSRFLGGVVKRQYPLGDVRPERKRRETAYAGVIRDVPWGGGDIPIRSRDVLTGRVRYLHPERGWEYKDVSMLKGQAYDEDIFRERTMARLVKKDKLDTPELEVAPEVDWEATEWRMASVYQEGEYLGGEPARFEG